MLKLPCIVCWLFSGGFDCDYTRAQGITSVGVQRCQCPLS